MSAMISGGLSAAASLTRATKGLPSAHATLGVVTALVGLAGFVLELVSHFFLREVSQGPCFGALADSQF